MKKTVFFDLDGTLIDSGEGIMNSGAAVLEKLKIIYSEDQLYKFIGPPIEESLRLFGLVDDSLQEGVKIFRSIYDSVGKYENSLYPGIKEALSELYDRGYKMYVATSKLESTAVEILKSHNLDKYFIKICGSNVERTRTSKKHVIKYLLEAGVDSSDVIMVGDTYYDVQGSAEYGIPCIYVNWGYGKHEDLKDDCIVVDNVDELIKRLV